MTGLQTVQDFGAVGDGVTDDSDALRAAADTSCVILPPGNYRANNLVIDKPETKFYGFGDHRITKNAAGPLFTVTAEHVEFSNVNIEGNGGAKPTWGVNFDIRSRWFRFTGGRNWHAASYCFDFTANDLTVHCQIANTSIFTSDTTIPCIRLAPLDKGSTDKLLVNIAVENNRDLVDTNGCQVVVIVGCSFRNVIFNANSKKVILTGNRMATVGADTTILGVNHAIIGNAHAGRFVIPNDFCSSCSVGLNRTVYPSVDLSSDANNILIG